MRPRHPRAPPSLRTLLGVAFAACAVLAVAGASLLAGREADAQARAAAADNLRALAAGLADQLDRGVFERWRDVTVAAALPSMRDPSLPVADRRAILRRLHDTYPDYALVVFLDARGHVVADSRQLAEGLDASARSIVRRGLERPTVEDVHEAIVLANLLPRTSDGLPPRFLDIAAPVHDASGATIGVVAAHLYWSWAEGVARRFREVIGPARRVDPLVVSVDGTVLLGPRPLVGRPLPPAALARGPAAWPDGEAYLSAAAATRGYRDYPGLGWTVVVRQPAEVSATDAAALARRIAGHGLLALLVAAPLGWLLARWVARPLTALAAASERAHELGDAAAFPDRAAADAPYREARILARALGRLVGGLREGRDAHALLVREADHRLKNSLQSVAAILSLHARRTADPAARAAIADAVAQVRTVAEVHRALYRADGTPGEAVDLGAMLRDLCEQHGRAAVPAGVEIECDAPEGYLVEGARALPLGLLAAELITNAGKHAFPGGRAGTVRVALERRDGAFELVVEDDGAGMSAGAEPDAGLGGTLVRRLATQARGELRVESRPGGGTRVAVRLAPRPPALRDAAAAAAPPGGGVPAG